MSDARKMLLCKQKSLHQQDRILSCLSELCTCMFILQNLVFVFKLNTEYILTEQLQILNDAFIHMHVHGFNRDNSKTFKYHSHF